MSPLHFFIPLRTVPQVVFHHPVISINHPRVRNRSSHLGLRTEGVSLTFKAVRPVAGVTLFPAEGSSVSGYALNCRATRRESHRIGEQEGAR